MKTDTITPAILLIIFVSVMALLAVQAQKNDTARLYIGDCVDIVADREGAHALTPSEKWDTFADYCAERYQNR